ncbi:hypothetical protein ACVWXU_006264 [Streptomyces sp. TE33382]
MPDLPAGPPTPPIPLAALLAREELGLRRIAGPADADLLWVHTSEMADPYPYLLGGELLLSAGVLLTDPDRYAARLVEAGAAALGFGVRPVHETVPRALVEACERHGLPLIEVPPGTPFTAIARAVWRLMSEARHRELRRVTRAQQALATAAAPPRPGARGAAAARRAAGGPGGAADGGGRGTARGGQPPGTGATGGAAAAGEGGGPGQTALARAPGFRASGFRTPGFRTPALPHAPGFRASGSHVGDGHVRRGAAVRVRARRRTGPGAGSRDPAARDG